MAGIGWHIIHDGQRLFRKTKAAARRLAQQLADEHGQDVTVREVEAPKPRARVAPARESTTRRTVKAKRNPAIRGVDFTGEEWAVAGMGKRGRIETFENSRQDAERMADYLFGEGYRALTIRRTKAPTAKPTRGAKRSTIDTRPDPKRGRWGGRGRRA
jgi:hypothetical protein